MATLALHAALAAVRLPLNAGPLYCYAPALMMLFMISSFGHLVSLFDQLDRFLVFSCLATASLLFLKPCHVFVCPQLTQHAKSLHSAEESADAQRIVQGVGTYHEPRPQKSRAALALQRQERPNSRTELGPRSGTFTLYHIRGYVASCACACVRMGKV